MNTIDKNIEILIDELIQLDEHDQLVKLQKDILGRLQPSELHAANKAQYDKISNYLNEPTFKRFNMHELFTMDDVNFHMQTINMYEQWLMDNDKDLFNSTTNMLYGIWDGFLYSDLLPSMEDAPDEIKERIKKTIDLIK